MLLFFFVPWSVINLVDFYLVKKGRYDVASFFTPSGVYGGWRWTALIPYVIALGAQVPLIDQTLYVGPMVGARRRRHLLAGRLGRRRPRLPRRNPHHRRPGPGRRPRAPGRSQLLKGAMSTGAMIVTDIPPEGYRPRS